MKRSRHPLYMIWYGMIARCHNPKSTSYRRYGARGITVCQRWRDSFDNFCADVGDRPSPTHSLDRYPDNGGNYEPNNVRWATPLEQAANSSCPLHAIIDGKDRLVRDVARERGLNHNTVLSRIKDYGWTPDEALSVSAGSMWERPVVYRGQQRSVGELCKEHGVATKMVFYRLKRGWSIEDAIEKPSRRVIEAARKVDARRGA